MCVTTSPARLSSTIVFGNRAFYREKLIHLIGYQNVAEPLSDFRASSSAYSGLLQGFLGNLSKAEERVLRLRFTKPNAMILPIPSSAALGPDNMIDTRPFGGFLSEYVRILRPPVRSRRDSFGEFLGSDVRSVQVFERGSYTVVLARDASAQAIMDALERVPPSKRPAISPELIEAYMTIYPGWHLAICCFDRRVENEPLLWWYQPSFQDLFLPGLDSHDGRPPNVLAEVEIDHSLIVGTRPSKARGQHHARVGLPGMVPADLHPLFPDFVTGLVDQGGTLANGDWWADHNGYITRELRSGLQIEVRS